MSKLTDVWRLPLTIVLESSLDAFVIQDGANRDMCEVPDAGALAEGGPEEDEDRAASLACAEMIADALEKVMAMEVEEKTKERTETRGAPTCPPS